MPAVTAKEWLNDPVVHPAWCWYLKLTDGTEMGFTSHDKNITYNNVLYEAATGFVPSAVETSNNMAVDNLEVQGFLNSDRITSHDLMSGRYDMAEVWVYILNWADLGKLPLIVRRGMLGEVKHSKQSFTADLRGLLDAYQAKAGKIYQKICRAHFGDSKCQADVTAYTASSSVSEIYTDGNIETYLSQATTFFNYGILTWTSGKNNGLKIEVKYYTLTTSGGIIQPFTPPIWVPAVGDTFTVIAGCDGNFTTCQARGNYINFRAEPYVPGNDYMTSYPSAGSGNTTTNTSGTSAVTYPLISSTGGANTYSYTDTNGVIQHTDQTCTVVTIQIAAAVVTDPTKLAYIIWVPSLTYFLEGGQQYTMGLNNSYIGSSNVLASVNIGAAESEATSTWQHCSTTGAWTKVQIYGADYWQAPARTLLTDQPLNSTFQIVCRAGEGIDAANVILIFGALGSMCDCVRPPAANNNNNDGGNQ